MSPATDEVKTSIGYLVPTSRINRRFWAPGKEYNTGVYASYEVTVRNARQAGPFTLDEQGFCLGHDHADVTLPRQEGEPGDVPLTAEQQRDTAVADAQVPELHRVQPRGKLRLVHGEDVLVGPRGDAEHRLQDEER